MSKESCIGKQVPATNNKPTAKEKHRVTSYMRSPCAFVKGIKIYFIRSVLFSFDNGKDTIKHTIAFIIVEHSVKPLITVV